MNPTTNTEAAVADVAAKLTEAQRAALMRAELDGNLDRYFARFISVPVGKGLVKAQLATAVWSGVMLNDRGLAVRQHLEQGATAGEVAAGAADHTITAKGAQP